MVKTSKTNTMNLVNGKLFEQITFKNGLSGWYFSDKAHKVYYHCFLYGLDANDFQTFDNVYSSIK